MSSAASTSQSFFSRERSVAEHGFNRWLVPPAALAIHLCIGMAYGFSVFWLPLSRAVGVSEPKACPAEMSFFDSVVTTSCDWKISMLGWTFTLFFVFLGSSAAVFGHWLETAGPRKAGLAAAACWCGGLLISAAGVYLHQIWMLWLGSGVIGGIGLGLGYISPVSTLIKWFPDRRGMATGMAIMGFGGGAMIGAPLADKLMSYFATPTSVGVWQTFVAMAAIYFVFMVGGALGYRVPRDGWTPEGWTPPTAAANKMVTSRHVHLDVAWKTPQFWLLWAVLTLNVSAGIGVIGMASPMLQEVFGGHLIGLDIGFSDLSPDQKKKIAAIAAGFTGLLSLCNIGGRFFWATGSDKLGRKTTYAIFFVLGFFLYAAAPWAATQGNVILFVLFFCIILSMYGGGFATIPAYLADIFGTHHVGAIHGRLLTAWSTAGVLGPVLVNYIRDYQLDHGVARDAVYNQTMYILAGLLVLGLVCDLAVRPVAERLFMTDDQVAAEKKTTVAAVAREEAEAHADFEDFVEEGAVAEAAAAEARRVDARRNGGARALLILAWAAVGVPLAWGVSITLQKTFVLFH
ncbi:MULTISPECIES: OFA family MFS transporter [Methylosinus]|uniref:MFS transporter n=1 Tax=Methylosinus trichosporium (strain ATCC 35070 / NCIMB 11131 / UNIQEM 75 / OB3b) TaxID=595536 RepID=A0A2D2D300_METT3|nr:MULTISPECIES: OFA family MFS transporter [Methylosinus]ATQ69345.1 MFS transporter [Methylosinus trichosporium OB3b]OBS52862.1 MFS transporter [Methylosinus sp. 3S-1]